jgi:hypothetical protein
VQTQFAVMIIRLRAFAYGKMLRGRIVNRVNNMKNREQLFGKVLARFGSL